MADFEGHAQQKVETRSVTEYLSIILFPLVLYLLTPILITILFLTTDHDKPYLYNFLDVHLHCILTLIAATCV